MGWDEDTVRGNTRPQKAERQLTAGRLITATVALPRTNYDKPEKQAAFWQPRAWIRVPEGATRRIPSSIDDQPGLPRTRLITCMVKPTFIHGEIIPPLAQPSIRESPKAPEGSSNEHLNLIASWLDDRFEIPGTSIRFGLDALIGWIPGIGDALAALASLFLVWAAWKRGAARITVLRMMLNLAIEDTLGALPIVGDVAHVAWKANRRNYNLLIRDDQHLRQHTWQDWLFVIGVCLIMLLLLLAPFVFLIYLFKTQHLLL